MDQLRNRRESALYRALDPEGWDWDRRTSFAALTVDELRVANWQRTENGQKGKQQPEPIDQPGRRRAKEAEAVEFQRTAEAWRERMRKRYKTAA